MKLSTEIKKALKNKKPVVALESTIISHGMPFPYNLQTANEVERTVRENGAVPATIGIINGEIKIGLSKKEIELLASTKGVMKLSTREIPLCLAYRKNGATTVSATLFIAESVKIDVFATGGIGGVHRGVLKNFDISRDLEELAIRDMIVVSAGVKSILDLQKTIEYLETKGVLVLGYKTGEFPAFYSRKSGIKIQKVDTVEEIVSIFNMKKKYSLKGALLVTNPVPEEDEIPFEVEEKWIRQATKEAEKEKIEGQSLTPYLLAKLCTLSNGKTLKSNISLIKNNAKLASLISKKLSENGLD